MGWRPAPKYDPRQGRWYCRFRGFHPLGKEEPGLVNPAPPPHILVAFARVLADGGYGEDPASSTRRPLYVAEAVARWCAEHPGRWARDMARKISEWQPELRLRDVEPCSLDDEEPGTLGAFVAWLQKEGARRFEVKVKRNPDGTVACRPDGTPIKARREWREPASAQTVRHALSFAVRVLRWASRPRRGWLRAEQIGDRPRTPRPVPRPRDLTAETVRTVLSAKLGKAEPIVRFMFASGARPGEACRLDWSDVDLARGTAVLRESKTAKRTGKSRVVFLTPEASAVLIGQGERRAGPVFVNGREKQYTSAALGKIIRRRGVTAYQARHTFAQAVLDQFGIEDVARLLGHSDLRMAQTYARVRDERARQVTAGLRLPSSGPKPRDQGKAKRNRPASAKRTPPPPRA